MRSGQAIQEAAEAEILEFRPAAKEQRPLLLDRTQAAAFVGISPSLLSELSPDADPTVPYIRLTPGGQKWWTEEGLRAAIDRLYLDQVARHLLPVRLLSAA